MMLKKVGVDRWRRLTINLLSHASKLLIRIIYNTIQSRIKENLGGLIWFLERKEEPGE